MFIYVTSSFVKKKTLSFAEILSISNTNGPFLMEGDPFKDRFFYRVSQPSMFETPRTGSRLISICPGELSDVTDIKEYQFGQYYTPYGPFDFSVRFKQD